MIQLISIIGVMYLAASVAPIVEPQELVDDPTTLQVESAGQAGLKVVMDPATGKILENPTSAELQAVGRDQSHSLPRRSSWDLRGFSLPGGGEGVALEKWAHHSLAVKRSDNGELRVQCIQGDVHEAHELPLQEPAEEQE